MATAAFGLLSSRRYAEGGGIRRRWICNEPPVPVEDIASLSALPVQEMNPAAIRLPALTLLNPWGKGVVYFATRLEDLYRQGSRLEKR